MSKVVVNQQQTQAGTSVLGLLGIVFIVMKLTGIEPVASWSWWWVTAPFWGGLALVLGILTILFVMYVIAMGIATVWDWVDAKQRKRK